MKALYSAEYEQCLLGSMILDNSCIPEVVATIHPEYFYTESYKKIFNTIVELNDKGCAVDLVVLTGEVKGIMASVITSLTEKITTGSNYAFYAEKIKNFYMAREFQREVGDDLANISDTNIAEILNKTESKMTNLLTAGDRGVVATSRSMIEMYTQMVDDAIKTKPEFLGIKSGYPTLDELLDGIPKSALSIIAARPSIGKSALATNMITNIALSGTPIALFSLEMSNMEVMTRIVASETGIKSYFAKHGMITTSTQLTKMNNFMGRFYDTKSYFYDSNNTEKDINSIIAKIRALAQQGVKIFFIDHLGLVEHPNKQMKSFEQLGDITMRLHLLAQRLDIAIVCLHQLNRVAEGKTPTLADLRGSGDIEQNADVVMFLHRERAQGNEVSIPTELIITKNRNGQCGTVNLDFIPSLAKFNDAGKKEWTPKESKN